MDEKIKTNVKAEITDSDTKRYTVNVKVTQKETGEPVPKGKVIVTAKKGRIVGESKVSEDGTATITSAITKKDYKLKIIYEENHKYEESKTKINFKSEYLFYKTSSYLWVSIIIVIIVLCYIILLNSLVMSNTPSLLIKSLIEQLPYIKMSTTETISHLCLANAHYIYGLINLLIWVLIISFVIAGVYATQFNPNLHNIIRKNVTNHTLFQNFFGVVILILIIITALEVVISCIV